MPGGVFIKHRVVHICQAVDLLFGKHGSEAYRLLHRHRIGGQNLLRDNHTNRCHYNKLQVYREPVPDKKDG